jgi:hypothetical protein
MTEYWMVIMTDPDSGREWRFKFFVDPDDAESVAGGQAWACWAKATHHGWVARAEHVRRRETARVPVGGVV